MYEPQQIYFVTARCHQRRLLLRPSKETNAVLGGVLAKAVRQAGVELFAFAFASNHLHLLVRAPNGNLPQFMQYLLANISKKVGALVAWRGSFWERRYSAEPVLDEDALLRRVRYILAHGVKEGLVRCCEEWPGLTSLPELLGRPRRSFRWFSWKDRWGHRSGGKAGGRFDPQFSEQHELVITHLPLTRFVQAGAWRRFIRRALKAIERDARLLHRRVLGRAGVFSQDPHQLSEPKERSPRPLCHASSGALIEEFRERYRAYVAAFVSASQKWRHGEFAAVFPPRAIRPFFWPHAELRSAQLPPLVMPG